jgi:putative DNA primase/helicase
VSSNNGQVPASKVEATLGYAARGWFVFPLHYALFGKDGTVRCSCDLGAACEHIGKHPWWMKTFKNGFKSATNDPDLIKTIWTAYSEANIGIATGKKSGIFVLDVDPRHDGPASLGEHAADPGTDLIVLTGGGGTHFYYAYDPQHPVESQQGVRPGIDVKGDKGYVVAPPSNHRDGGYYRWKHEGE